MEMLRQKLLRSFFLISPPKSIFSLTIDDFFEFNPVAILNVTVYWLHVMYSLLFNVSQRLPTSTNSSLKNFNIPPYHTR